jgi:argininosuccinate synthase
MSDIKKAVLAYSGGLDTSVILKWLQDTYGCEIVTFTADLGQGEELEPARAKALQFGIKPENIFIDDLREEFVRDFVFPMFRANTIYEGEYLLGTSIARPLIAKRQIDSLLQESALQQNPYPVALAVDLTIAPLSVVTVTAFALLTA